MIQAVTTPTHRREFARRLAGKPYFEATMGTACTLFGEHPASGWRFYLLPGTGALSLRGGTATLCGRLPAGPAGEEAEEELQGFLRFLRVDRLISEPAAPDGWQMTEPLLLWELPQGERLPLPPPPSQELYLETQPSMIAGQPSGISPQYGGAGRFLFHRLYGADPWNGRLLCPDGRSEDAGVHGGQLRPQYAGSLYVRRCDSAGLAGQGTGRLAHRAAGQYPGGPSHGAFCLRAGFADFLHPPGISSLRGTITIYTEMGRNMIEEFYQLKPEVLALDRKALDLCREQFVHVEEIRDYNQLKMLRAFTDCGVEARHFWGSSGYGVWDDSRNKLEEVFARCMGAEAALVRPQFMSGTHTLTVALFGLLRTGDTLLAATGRPYDTLEGVIGIGEAGKGCGTLRNTA